MRPEAHILRPVSTIAAGLCFSLCFSFATTGYAQQEDHRLLNKNSGLYLAVSGGSRFDGGNVIQWRDEEQRDIWWTLENADGDKFKLRNQNSGKYLAVAGGDRRDGANIIQWSDVGQPDILWKLEPANQTVQDGCYRLVNSHSGKSLAVDSGSSENGANVIQWPDFGQPDIIWCKQ